MRKHLLYIFFIFLVFAVQAQKNVLLWSDEFNGSTINSTYWGFDIGNGNNGWGNQELQYYTSRTENAKVSNGNLIITAKKENYSGYSYTSARLVTRSKISWKYGRIEVRANIPAGRGIWPAIWMLPDQWNYGDGGWPDNGEIDIMEYVGFNPGVIYGSLHNHTNYGGNSITQTISISGVEDSFHVFALEWSEEKIDLYVDDSKYFTYYNPNTGWENWPFNKEFYLILNIAVGGTWGGQQGVDDSIFPQTFEIDYIRVYGSQSTDSVSIEKAWVDTKRREINLDFNESMSPPQNENTSFSVLMNNVNANVIDSIYLDVTENKRIKIAVKDSIRPEDIVSLSYSPGNIQTVSGKILQAFEGLLVDNTVVGFFNFPSDDNTIMAFPNPFSDYVSVTSKAKINSITAYDINGKKIYFNNQTFPSNAITINSSDWPQGNIFIEIVGEKGQKSKIKTLKIIN